MRGVWLYNCTMKLSKNGLRTLMILCILSVLPVVLMYIPFVLHLRYLWGIPLQGSGMQPIYANWDGPNYVLNAITLYDPAEIAKRAFLARPNEYYAAHFPLYSLLIRMVAPFAGYLSGALLLQILSGIVLNVAFYYLIRSHSRHPLWLTFVFTIFPPRYWVLRAVIAPELLIVACVIVILMLWDREKYLASGMVALIAVLLKFQAVVFTPVFVAVIFERVLRRERIAVSSLVATLLPLTGYGLVAMFYAMRFGNAHAYFRAQEIVHMGMDIPFGLFNYARAWVGTGWLETPALYLMGLFMLIVALSRGFPRIYFWFALGYTAMLTLIPQIDIMRLAMPLAPLFILVFHRAIESRVFRYGLVASVPMFYLFALNFIMTNRAPIADWGLFR